MPRARACSTQSQPVEMQSETRTPVVRVLDPLGKLEDGSLLPPVEFEADLRLPAPASNASADSPRAQQARSHHHASGSIQTTRRCLTDETPLDNHAPHNP